MRRNVWIVFQKEMIDNLRDRRSLLLAMIYPLIGALLLGVLISMVGGMMKGQRKSVLQLPVIGVEHAPQLITYLKQHNVAVKPPPANPSLSVREGKVSVVLVIPEGAGERLTVEKNVKLKMIINPSRVSTVLIIARVTNLLNQYGRKLSRERLKALNIGSSITRPISIENVNVGRTRDLAGFFVSMLPPFIMFTIFVGGVYLAIDTTAGERERGSLEPLLTNPVPRGQLMLGKALATCLFTSFALILQLVSFKVMFYIVGGGAKQAFDPPTLNFIYIFLICLPLVVFAVGIQIIVATFSRSYKETQTYLALLPLIPSVPGMILVFVPIQAHTWMMFIPTFGHALLISRLVQQETVQPVNALICGLVTFLLGALMLFFARQLYVRDKMIFGSG